jgi:hypothetical protein
MKETLANTDKAKDILGWNTSIELEKWLGEKNE